MIRRLLLLLALVPLLGPGLSPPARAEGLSAAQRAEVVKLLRETLVRDPSILRDALEALQSDEVRQRAQARRSALTALGAKLVDGADPVLGNPQGDVTIVEFYDTRCPYCRAMRPVLASLLRQDPKVRLVLKDMPVLGPASLLQSRALLAAQRQGGYFKLQDAIMGGSADAGSREAIKALAEQAGLDGAQLLRDMDDPSITQRLQANLQLAHQLGIEGTPAFVIGSDLVSGAVELAELQRAVALARGQR